MAFHFPLESVFHFRQSVEHQQELRLRAANQQVARARHLIEHLDQQIATERSRQAQHLAAGMTSAELRFSLFSEAALQDLRRTAQQELLRLQALCDQQQRIFRQARRERETFESLRNRIRREYERDQNRREQRQLDEMFLLRQANLRRG